MILVLFDKASVANYLVGFKKKMMLIQLHVSLQVVNNFGNESNKDNLHAFSYTSLMDIMRDFSSLSVTRVVLGYVLMVSANIQTELQV